MLINTETRSEIIRVRVTPTQKQKFAAFSAAAGLCTATYAFRLVVGQVEELPPVQAHRRPRPDRSTGTNHRPLKPSKQHKCPGARVKQGGPIPHARI